MATTTTTSTPVPRDPTADEALALFKAIEEKFPAKTLGEDKWYLLALANIVSGGQPNFAPLLYKHVIVRPEFQSAEERQKLLRRMREVLFKLVIIVGVCKPLEAVFDLDAAVERDEDRVLTGTRQDWQCDEANLQRGEAWLSRLYKHNLQGVINNTFEGNKDFDWLTKNITYGLFLSDRNVLNDVETEMTVVTGIVMQNLPRESAWHMRGLRRIGVAKEDVEAIRECCELSAKFCGISLHKVPRVEDIEHEV
ncbi:hypothetical protein COCC4DRAFT_56882 [Bipolaris maydis ATCC 48331]|uniref:Carboxymuconolactone decarboxylase-like domain-containing protein n=2 Tax=Cochliobolus heterostrophus TaxID=5016 RepID=M2SJH7_COCH5|nr:uncharacterized protein COCC4DRAFT_56882 [Bipolaris maydis ATCC 48331]EMD85480.1 hypothetical protein COCHEDRAFT_1024424 [Bipolaris maydis C5]KAJ5023742.1 hypothetical protein J3E73DRAFT_333473 [Bipolaris maydis]EMD90430.1 hypothetical protein COCHEDRAFT_1022348 [Bipolaris maydis C5]ENI09357.1 hypothetical protein COCC4DRAFT_56882 [Bipolaris maydis ATCC 48331]KAJ5058317.1 hypothetical protein J3E74DRAFT_359328 [Bipolaris maydis]